VHFNELAQSRVPRCPDTSVAVEITEVIDVDPVIGLDTLCRRSLVPIGIRPIWTHQDPPIRATERILRSLSHPRGDKRSVVMLGIRYGPLIVGRKKVGSNVELP
jgi:hypothetical protein